MITIKTDHYYLATLKRYKKSDLETVIIRAKNDDPNDFEHYWGAGLSWCGADLHATEESLIESDRQGIVLVKDFGHMNDKRGFDIANAQYEISIANLKPQTEIEGSVNGFISPEGDFYASGGVDYQHQYLATDLIYKLFEEDVIGYESIYYLLKLGWSLVTYGEATNVTTQAQTDFCTKWDMPIDDDHWAGNRAVYDEDYEDDFSDVTVPDVIIEPPSRSLRQPAMGSTGGVTLTDFWDQEDLFLNNRFAEGYYTTMTFFEPDSEMLAWIKDYADGRPILDLGCGNGTLVRRLQNIGAVVTGFDKFMSRDMMAESGFQMLDTTETNIFRNLHRPLYLFCRPCHNDWVDRTIDNISPEAEILYIGKPENVADDIQDHDYEMIDHEGSSTEGERVYRITKRS